MVEAIVITEFHLPKLAALLSMMGSALIMGEMGQDIRQQGRRGLSAVSRILLSMSIGDLCSSLGWFLGTWPVPAGYNDLFYRGYNHGTIATCRAQGFLFQLGACSSLFFNASLAVIYLLTVRYQWTKTQLVRVFTPLAAVVWICSWTSAIWFLVKDLYYPVGPMCWINAPELPQLCFESPGDEWNEDGCQYRDVTNVLIGMQLVPTWGCILLDSVIMCIIYRQISSLEERTVTTANNNSNSNTRSSIVARQGLYYIGGFFLTFGLFFVSVIYYLIRGDWNVRLDRAGYFFIALQGFWNFCVFSWGRVEMKTTAGRVVKRLLWEQGPRLALRLARFVGCRCGGCISCSKAEPESSSATNLRQRKSSTNDNLHLENRIRYIQSTRSSPHPKSSSVVESVRPSRFTVSGLVDTEELADSSHSFTTEEPDQGLSLPVVTQESSDVGPCGNSIINDNKANNGNRGWNGNRLDRPPSQGKKSLSAFKASFISDLSESDFLRDESSSVDLETLHALRGQSRPAMLPCTSTRAVATADNVPTVLKKPERVASDVEIESLTVQSKAHRSQHKAPNKPERLASVNDTDEPKSRRDVGPPSRPERFPSLTETSTDVSGKSQAQRKGSHFAPTKPERLVSLDEEAQGGIS